MGPSWYWMPDVFERFFNDFDKKRSDFYDLSKLDPAYKVFFGKNDSMSIEDSLQKIKKVFEKEEKGSSIELEKFINEASLMNFSNSMELPFSSFSKTFLIFCNESSIDILSFFPKKTLYAGSSFERS